MNNFVGMSHYVMAVLFLLSVLSVVGIAIISLAKANRIFAGIEQLLIAPIVGIATVSIFSLILALNEIGIDSQVVWLFILALVIGAVLARRGDATSWEIGRFRVRATKFAPLFLVAAAVGLMPYLQLLVHPIFTPGFGTSASWTNNDLGAYIQMASNVIVSGHRDAGLVDGWNAGAQAAFDHPAAQSFYSALSQIIFRQPFQTGIVAMATVLGALFLAAVQVARSLSRRNLANGSLLSLSVVVINPATMAATANFFFAQILSIALVMGALACSLTLFKNRGSFRAHFVLVIVSIATVFTSVEISLVMVPLVVFFALIASPRELLGRKLLMVASSHLLAFLTLFVFFNDVVMSQINVLRRTTVGNIAGWQSNYTSISALIGFAPTQLGGPYSGGIRMLDVLLIVFLVCTLIYLFREKILNVPVLLSIVLLIMVLVAAFLKWGFTSYQTWKLISTVLPFLLVLLWSINGTQDESRRSSIRDFFPLLIIGATLSWSGFVWKDTQLSGFINPDVAEVALSEAANRQSGINILLAPFFETMAVSSITGVRSSLSSPTYQFSGGQALKYGCTLTTKDRASTIENLGPIVHERGNYVLLGSPICD